ncbi:uncharacterized protein TrAtP1_011571 [Trichoderma atroviride]|uniref:uncharacterized protein n=1 Tax=Hypocrea atroviridis TaxID=63577 RepID=UPI003332BAC3|nr:hypothetical protein TrAtP1_011571 [Trichoderma atroviride]
MRGEALCPGLADGHHPRPIVYNHTLSADKSLVCAATTLAVWVARVATRFGGVQLPLLVTGGTRGNGMVGSCTAILFSGDLLSWLTGGLLCCQSLASSTEVFGSD